MTGTWIFLIFIAVLLMAAWLIRSRHTKSTSTDPYAKLLRRAMGDQAVVERLIELERRKHPTVPHPQLVRNAIERWERENH